MKRFFLFLTAVILLQPLRAKKIALLIGVGKYAPGTRWRPLCSVNDIDLIKKTLIAKGFLRENIITLTDSAATHDGITKAIENDLMNLVAKNDIVFFHFSGHGQQLYDDNGDEEDGLDESIVPYDAPRVFQLGQKEEHIRDDYLSVVFQQIRQKIGRGGQLIISLDACHSGTGTRGIGDEDQPMARGTRLIYGVPVTGGNKNKPDTSYGIFVKNTDIAPMACFYGSGPQELNYQYSTKDFTIGSLSYALCKVIEKADSTTTCRDIFKRIEIIMATIAPLQRPQAEGDLDSKIFNGTMVNNQGYFIITHFDDEKKVRINAGILEGITDTSTVFFYKENTVSRSADNLLVTGKVASIDLGEAEIILAHSLPKQKLEFAKVFANVQKQPFMISVNPGKTSRIAQLVSDALKDMENAAITNSPAQIYFETGKTGAHVIEMRNANGYLLGSWDSDKASDEQLEASIRARIKLAARALFIKSLNSDNEDLKLRAEIIFTNDKDKENYKDSSFEKNSESGFIQLHDSTEFKIRVYNEGIKKAYFSIIDIQPDDTFNILIPNSGEDPSSYSISPLESIDLPPNTPYIVGPPFGDECIKIIASATPVDYGPEGTRSAMQKMDWENEDEPLSQTENSNARKKASLTLYTLTLHYKIVPAAKKP